MATVRLTRGSSSIIATLPADVAWRMAATGAAGEAAVLIPRGHRAYSSTYINPAGGSLLRIEDERGAGVWLGVTKTPEWTASGLLLKAQQPWAILSKRYVSNGQVLTNTSPGVIVTRALQDAVDGIHFPIRTRLYEACGPVIDRYELRGQDCWSVITDMMRLSDGEISIDPETLIAEWTGALNGRQRMGLLVAGKQLQNARYVSSIDDRVTEVIATSGDQTFAAWDGSAAVDHWPAQTTVQGQDGARGLVTPATGELARRNLPMVTLEGEVGPELFSLRERDIVRVAVPFADFTGAMVTARIVARSLSRSGGRMRLGFQVFGDMTPATRAYAERQGGAMRAIVRGRRAADELERMRV